MTDSIQSNILQFLKEKYAPEIVILHGSRAAGKNRPDSDWDIFVFTSLDIKGGTEQFMGEQLDVQTVYMPVKIEEFVDNYGYVLHNAKILLDNEEEFGRKILEEAVQMYSLGKKLTETELTNRTNYMSRILSRMSGSTEKPELFLLYLGYFYEKSLQYWFELKGKFSKPVYAAIPEIQEADPEYYALLEVLFSGHSTNAEKFLAAEKINQILFGK